MIMRRDLLALTCAAATLVAGASWAQDGRGVGEGGTCKKSPPGSGEQLCIDDGTEASRGRTARDVARANRDQSSLPAAPTASAPPRADSQSAASTTSSAGSTWSSDQSASSLASTPAPAGASATVTSELIASAPVPDTPANRARYGQPMSHAGKSTAPRGN
jgi:hypothetical protein